MSNFKKNSDEDSPEDENLESLPSHEGIRPRRCASRLRHSRTCTCGRPQVLSRIRKHHHWVRLSACAHCLRADAATSSVASNPQTEVDRG
jgi:hypothetical protein